MVSKNLFVPEMTSHEWDVKPYSLLEIYRKKTNHLETECY